MDVQRAKELLTVLADGVDPLTGEVLPDDHVCNKGKIVRALHCAVEELSRRREKTLPESNGKPWTKELDDELCRLFDGGMKKERPLYALWPHLRRDQVPAGEAEEAVKCNINVAPQATKPSFGCATMGA